MPPEAKKMQQVNSNLQGATLQALWAIFCMPDQRPSVLRERTRCFPWWNCQGATRLTPQVVADRSGFHLTWGPWRGGTCCEVAISSIIYTPGGLISWPRLSADQAQR